MAAGGSVSSSKQVVQSLRRCVQPACGVWLRLRLRFIQLIRCFLPTCGFVIVKCRLSNTPSAGGSRRSNPTLRRTSASEEAIAARRAHVAANGSSAVTVVTALPEGKVLADATKAEPAPLPGADDGTGATTSHGKDNPLTHYASLKVSDEKILQHWIEAFHTETQDFASASIESEVKLEVSQWLQDGACAGDAYVTECLAYVCVCE